MVIGTGTGQAWDLLEQLFRQRDRADELLFRTVLAGKMLVGGRSVKVLPQGRAYAPENAVDVVVAHQLRVFGPCRAGGRVDTGTVNFVEFVEVARVEVVLKMAEFELAVERPHVEPEAGGRDAEALGFAIAGEDTLLLRVEVGERVLVVEQHGELSVELEVEDLAFR